MKKRGQVTIFVIVAVLIVVMAILIYLFYPKIKSGIGFDEKNPSAFLQSCLEKDLKESINTVSLQGGSLDPEHFYLYQDNKIEYLCYTDEYYVTCVMQQPMLKSHIESQITTAISEKANQCLTELEKNYKNNGYQVEFKSRLIDVELLPKRVATRLNSSLVLTKAGEKTQYDSLNFAITNNLYELVSIANSILNMEARYGNSETTIYMDYYHDLKVEKFKQTDGTTIYILTDRNSENKFQFASRSLAWPPGYGN